MRNRLIALLVLFTVVIFSSAQAQTTARKFEAGKNTFLLDGEPFVVKAVQSIGDEYHLYLYLLEYP